jgi:5-methylcytosine-specific restriction endonuclease McrA
VPESDSSPKIVLRKEAAASGLKYYFTGRPCKHGHVTRRHTHNGTCSGCVNENAKRWSKKNNKRVAANTRRWRTNNPEKTKVIRKKSNVRWYKLHREEMLEYGKARYWAKRDQILAKEKVRREKTKVVRSIRHRNWRLRNVEYVREKARAWNAANIEKVRAYKRNRKAKKRANGGSHSGDEISEILRLQKGRCAYCRVELDSTTQHVDHIVPLIRGGINDRKNLQVLCEPCNLRKGCRDPIYHAQTLGLLL